MASEPAEVRRFLEAIRGRYGYDFCDYSEASIQRRVCRALLRSGLPSLRELEARVVEDPALFARVLGELTVRASQLFRDPELYLALRARALPRLRTYPFLRIWHCGCADGEEVYSDAVVLAEEGLYERAQLYATDLSPLAIAHARQGVYPAGPADAERYRRAGGHAELERYGTRAYGRFAFDAALRRNVLFFEHDLVTDQVFGEMHLVFCRNVLLYFGPELRRRALEKLARSLVPGGFLCLGRSERPPGACFAEVDPDVRLYRREA